MRWVGSIIAVPATLIAVFLGARDLIRDSHKSAAATNVSALADRDPEPNPLCTAAGVTEPGSKSLKIVSELPGTIDAIRVIAGDHVTKGQAIVELHNDIQQAGVQLARATLERARAELERLKNWDRPE